MLKVLELFSGIGACSKALTNLGIERGEEVEALCAIGDEGVCFSSKNNGASMNYTFIMLQAKKYITKLGGFEKLAEWGLF